MNHGVFRSAKPFSAMPAPAASAARPIYRAVADIRRGVAVLIEGNGAWMTALPAETATADTMAEFLGAIDGEAALLLSASRVDRGAMDALPVPGASGIAALTINTAGLSVAMLHALADPAASHPDDTPWCRKSLSFAGSPEHAEAALELAKLARLLPAMLVGRVKTQAAPADMISVHAAAVLAHRLQVADSLVAAAEARVPLDEANDARIVAFRPADGGIEHLAILIGRPESADAPLVRVHSACLTGDLLGSRRCDCGPQLHQAIRRMAAEGAGVLLYMAQEGRGIGLVNKLRAYGLQDAGLDTVDANRALGFGADERSFAAAATMLRQLGTRRIRLLTNNPVKIAELTANGIEVVGRVSHAIAANGENDDYLATKALRFGHLLG